MKHSTRQQISRAALFVQLTYASMVVLWQLVGVLLVESGARPPGPSASLTTAGLAGSIGVALAFSHKRLPRLFLALSLFSGLSAVLALANAITGEANLWPSIWTRLLGAIINFVGVVGASLAAVSFFSAGASRPNAQPGSPG
jgi:hypothetical protein